MAAHLTLFLHADSAQHVSARIEAAASRYHQGRYSPAARNRRAYAVDALFRYLFYPAFRFRPFCRHPFRQPAVLGARRQSLSALLSAGLFYAIS